MFAGKLIMQGNVGWFKTMFGEVDAQEEGRSLEPKI
jgi:hypothetical protein